MHEGEPRPATTPVFARTALWLTAYVVACLLGRTTVIQPENLSLVWPATGVGLAWMAWSTRRLDLTLLVGSTVVVLLLTEGGVVRSALSVVTAFECVLAVWLMRRWIPGTWGGGGRAALRLNDFGVLLAIITGSALACALARTVLGVLLIPEDGFSLLVGRWGRNTAAMVTIGVFGLVLGAWLAERRDQGWPPLPRPSRSALLHLVGIELSTALILVAFWLNPEIPTTYVLSLTAVWVGIRFGPLITAAHCLLAGMATVLMTINGLGPIADVPVAQTRALLAQAFVIIMMVTGLIIALIRMQINETISRLERSEESLSVRADELDLLVSHLDDGVAVFEEGGRIVHANRALRTLFGSRADTGTQRVPEQLATHDQLYHPDGRPLTHAELPYVRALAGENVSGEEYRLHVHTGGSRIIEVSAFPMPHTWDAPPRAMVVLRDVTVATTLRESLVSFAGTVAHDLNNPLSVIDGWAEALQDELADSQTARGARATPMVRHIRNSVAQMRRFVTDLLAHAVARDQALQWESVPLRHLVKHISADRSTFTETAVIRHGEMLNVWGDRTLLRQVLDNLIGNALKYVAPGTTPQVLVDAEALGDGWARITVRDNGIGIAADQRERVFDDFHRLSASTYQGTGLGLAICKRIIERHGGTISVSANADGVGSCFEFVLPMSAEAMLAARDDTAQKRAGSR